MKHPVAEVLSGAFAVDVALEVIRKYYDHVHGEWKPEAGKLWSSIPARPVIWGIDEVKKVAPEYAHDTVCDMHDLVLRKACEAMDRSNRSLCIVVTSLEFRPDYLKTLRSARSVKWIPLGPIDVRNLWEQSPELKDLVDRNASARRFLLDCGGHPRSIALTIGELLSHPGAAYDQLLAALFTAVAEKYNLKEFVHGLNLDLLAPCILGLYENFDPSESTPTSMAHRETLYLNSTGSFGMERQIPFTSPVFILRACELKQKQGYVNLERLIFPLLQQYFKLGTSLESRPELSVEQPSYAKFERAVLLRDMIVRLFLHYYRGKDKVSAQASVPVHLADLYGISDQANNRSLPRLHSAALDAKDIVLHIRQPGELLDLREQMPLQLGHLQGRDLLSTPVKCVSNQDGMMRCSSIL